MVLDKGGILSPYLFSRYVRELLHKIEQTRCGCSIGVNILAYADDIVLLAPSWSAMQDLLHVLAKHNTEIDVTCSIKKTVCMVFAPKQRSKIVSTSFPSLRLGSECLQYVNPFKYLGHVITCNMTDDQDIQREVF